jgi:hypothetical protein
MFSIQKFPELTYFVQEAQLPMISLGQAMQASSVHDIKTPGDTMEFGDLQVNFMVDEKMDNYIAIYNWIIGLGFPIGHRLFTELMADNANSYSTASKSVSDCSLTVLNSDNNPTRTFTFVDAFPTNLSAISFQSTNNDVNYVVATLDLAYSYYKIE